MTDRGLLVWLSFQVEGETFEVQIPTNTRDEVLATLEARDQLQWILRRAVDASVVTHYQAEEV